MNTKQLVLACSLALVGCDSSVGSTASGEGNPQPTSGNDQTSGGQTSGNPTEEPGDDSTGEPSEGSTGFDVWECVETPMVVEPDVAGPDGTTAQQIIDEIVGTYAGQLTWQDAGPVRYGGALGTTDVSLEVIYDGGEIRHVDREIVPFCGHDGPCGCLDGFEVDVSLRVTSADGALDETWSTTAYRETVGEFSSTPDPIVRIVHAFDASMAEGDLSTQGFDTSEGVSVQSTSFTVDLNAGYAGAAVFVTATQEGIGSVGGGPIGSMSTIREVSWASCNAAPISVCASLGCTEVAGSRHYQQGEDSCACEAPQDYCLAEPLLEGERTLYVREVSEAFEGVSEEVVAFEGTGELAEPWRPCTEAPENPACTLCLEAPAQCQ